jgi:hypothetical protein
MDKQTVCRGRIERLIGSFGSGIATLVLDNAQVFCENAPTVRALEAAFGDVIGEGHTIDNEDGGHIGQEIVYGTDGLILSFFVPAEEWDAEVEAGRIDLERYEVADG